MRIQKQISYHFVVLPISGLLHVVRRLLIAQKNDNPILKQSHPRGKGPRKPLKWSKRQASESQAYTFEQSFGKILYLILFGWLCSFSHCQLVGFIIQPWQTCMSLHVYISHIPCSGTLVIRSFRLLIASSIVSQQQRKPKSTTNTKSSTHLKGEASSTRLGHAVTTTSESVRVSNTLGCIYS